MIIEKENLTVISKGTLRKDFKGVPFVAIKDRILGKSYDLSIAFVGPSEARSLNTAHRGKDYIPNTLSFSLTKKSGEIIMCLSAMQKEYKKFGMDAKTYLIYLLIHSMLHLKGYAHGSTMESKEKKLLAFFS